MAEIKFRPIGHYVLVKPEEAEKTTKSGIILTEKEPEKPQIATVVALGDGNLSMDGRIAPFRVKLNDKVYFKKYGGTEIELDGEKYMVLTEMDILGIIE